MSIDVPPLEPLEPLVSEPTPPAEPELEPQSNDQPRPARTRVAPRSVAAMLVVALLGGVAGAVLTRAVDRDPVVQTSVTRGPVQLDGDTLDIAAVIAKAEPSVVSISVGFGTRAGAGAGTGVVLTESGEILTNAHVVDGARTVRVTLAGESQSRAADVVGADEAADLALLRISGASGLPAADLGKSAELQVGDDVIAIGNALALRGNPTVTRGIVSGLNRSLDTESGTMTGLVQTDASISSGNSGGPLLNARGQVVGINTAVAASNSRTAAENIGFAIAIDNALPVIERLRGNGGTSAAAPRGYLGVTIADPTDGSRGAVVGEVESGAPAATAGIMPGDLITKVGDTTIDGAAALSAAVRSHAPGEEVAIVLVRDGAERTVRVTLAVQ